MPFGQLIVGPPGAGKTTFTHGMQHYFQLAGRKVAVINLDPANENLPYECAVNIEELVTLEAVQRELGLGPNGGLVYCMEYLLQNLDWLKAKLEPLQGDHYLLFDCPGQVELFNMHDSLRGVVQCMTQTWHYRLTAVHLVDSHLCTDSNKFLAALLVSLSTMLHLELPHVNVLSKLDLIESFGELPFGLDFYTDGGDLSRLADSINQDERLARYHKLTRGLCEVVEDFNLVSFATLDVQDEGSMRALVRVIDKANGYAFSGLERQAAAERERARGGAAAPQFAFAAAPPTEWDAERIGALQERYVSERPPEADFPTAGS